jgi:hypothetical protein
MLPLLPLPLLSIARGHDSRDHTIPGSPEQWVSGGETLGTRMSCTQASGYYRARETSLITSYELSSSFYSEPLHIPRLASGILNILLTCVFTVVCIGDNVIVKFSNNSQNSFVTWFLLF